MRAIDASGSVLSGQPVATRPRIIVLSSATFAAPDKDSASDPDSTKGGK